MSGAWSIHDKTDWYYVWGLTISLQNRLILCLGFDHLTTKETVLYLGLNNFMTKPTDTMSAVSPCHDNTHWHFIWWLNVFWCIWLQNRLYYVWALINSWQNILILYLRIDHFMRKQTDTKSWARPFHDITDWHHIWGSTISWQNRLMLCLLFHHVMTTPTETISGARPFHYKTDEYYV